MNVKWFYLLLYKLALTFVLLSLLTKGNLFNLQYYITLYDTIFHLLIIHKVL